LHTVPYTKRCHKPSEHCFSLIFSSLLSVFTTTASTTSTAAAAAAAAVAAAAAATSSKAQHRLRNRYVFSGLQMQTKQWFVRQRGGVGSEAGVGLQLE